MGSEESSCTESKEQTRVHQQNQGEQGMEDDHGETELMLKTQSSSFI